IKGEHATDAEERRAARICSLIVGLLAVVIGILAKGQNVAHLVALAFAVAASANLPVILLTLYWKRCNTGGVVAGLVVGTFTAIGLVLVSPNMTYPLAVKATNEKAIATHSATIQKANADLAAATDPAAQEKNKKTIAAAEKAKATSEKTIADLGAGTTNLVGLEKPLIELKNPGLISIPLGFLAVFIGSLLYRDRRAEEMWDELYVRSNTGIGRAAAAAH
ncbi:MAG: sodium:solute symporter family transporter, partial [Burkholderiales bacterium]